jgi:hypothetical protein
VVALNATVDSEPDVRREPLQPPEAVQAVALADDQVSMEAAPLVTLAGLAASVAVGANVGDVTPATLE